MNFFEYCFKRTFSLFEILVINAALAIGSKDNLLGAAVILITGIVIQQCMQFIFKKKEENKNGDNIES